MRGLEREILIEDWNNVRYCFVPRIYLIVILFDCRFYEFIINS